MNAAAVEAFLQDYVRAFVREDVDAVVTCWRFPAIIATPKGTVALDEPTFRRNTEALFRFYRAQGMVEAAGDLAGIHPLGPNVASVAVDYELRDSAGERVTSWRNGYLLRESEGAIQAIAAVADAEMDAWAARGTPMLGAEVEGKPMLEGLVRDETAASAT